MHLRVHFSSRMGHSCVSARVDGSCFARADPLDADTRQNAIMKMEIPS